MTFLKTTAAILTQLNHPLEIRELEIPVLKKGQVLVQLAYSGLCHTQLNEWRGAKGPDRYLPHTLGHEGSGIVLEIGEAVTKVKPGDHVVLSWIKGSGLDVSGTVYASSQGAVNSGAISTFLKIAVISENRLIPIASTIPLKEAALLGCAIPTGAGVIVNQMKIKKGESLAVFGVGGIGLSAILAARYLKAYPIVAIDIHAKKLEKAKIFGATHTIDSSREDCIDKIQQITDLKGVNFAFESAGKIQTMQLAFQSVKALGGCCILAGNLALGEKIQIDPFELIKGKKIMGTWGGGGEIDVDVPRFAKWFIQKENQLQEMISHEMTLEDVNDLMHLLAIGQVHRGLITLI